MGHLDDLKKQAEAARQIHSEQHVGGQEAAQNTKEVARALKLIYRYLKEVIQQLNAAKPEIFVDYQVEGYGSLTGLGQRAGGRLESRQ